MRQLPKAPPFAPLTASLFIGLTFALAPAAAPTASALSSKANRTVPRVTPPALIPQFSSTPSDAEIFGARIFEEPLIAIGKTSSSENRALAHQVLRYIENGAGEALEPFDSFLAAYPASSWRASLLVNTGIVHRRTGRFSRALAAWEEAWALSKGATDPLGRAVADRALGDYAEILGRLGRTNTLEALVAETHGRQVGGSAAEKISNAKDGLALMRTRPEVAFRCGPLAVDRVLAALRENYVTPKAVEDFPSTYHGTSLSQISKLANDVGQPMRMAKRSPGSAMTVPAIIHWKSGHFAALVREQDGRYLVEDATFGDQAWISDEALEEEATGYIIVGQGPLPVRWRAVGEAEGLKVWGKGATTQSNPQNFKPCDPKKGCGGGKCTSAPGMAVYDVHLMLVSLNITDEPVGYSPPLGPAVRFLATYNQREVFQPQTFSYMNLGPKWTFDWLSYIDEGLDPATSIKLYVRGGGQETYVYNSTTQSYGPHRESRAVVIRTSPDRYERHLPDGSVDVFEQLLGLSPSRKVFMTASIDPQGNALTFTYGASPTGDLRLAAIVDAIGQVTTLSYDLAGPGNDAKITKVTDPFGRFATFEYVGGRLERTTDIIGIESEFHYGAGAGDFIDSLTTPYGTTAFETGEVNNTPNNPRSRWLEVTDPLGGKERVEYHSNPGAPHNLPSTDVVPPPPGFATGNLNWRNTFYWDKRAMAAMADLPPGTLDYSKARIYHWLHQLPLPPLNSGVLESIKAPLENRLWYAYAGQPATYYDGTHAQPSKIARVLDDGTSQIYQYAHNLRGKVCESTDPMGRLTRNTYGTATGPDPVCTTGSSIDLLKVEQKNGVGWDVVRTTTYNEDHQPLTVTDAAGQATTYSYHPDGTGRLWTVVTAARNGHDGNPLTLAERTTTYEYYPDQDPVAPWRLKKVVGPSVGVTPGPSMTITYDPEGRVKTTTDSDNYVLTMDYDELDRPTKTTFPDSTYEETTYNRLDAEGHRDRLGRWSYTFHDALRRISQTRDPLLRTVTMDWCNCDSLDGITDGEGNETTWERDLQGRVKKEIRADGKFWEYTYETTTSRLKSAKDPKLQVKTYTYDLADKLTGIAYTNEVIPTLDVTYFYSPDPYGRLLRMDDGTGTTDYTYHPAGTLGALSLASVNGPLTGTMDLLEYAYDELGRIGNRKLNAAQNEVSYRFDSLGRLRTQLTWPGNFTYAYDGITGRLLSLVYPNGQRVDNSYYPNSGDRRLQEIHNKLPGGATLSKFGYTYDIAGNIETWSQQRGASSPDTYTFGHDLADQLGTAILSNTVGTLVTYGEAYDNAGNRTSHTVDSVATDWSYDTRNRITNQARAPFNITHDDNGNMTSDGTQTYEWDAENRLVAVKQGGNTIATFAYDGNGRRQQKTAGGVTHTYTYDGAQIVVDRLSTGVRFRFFDSPGIDQHLGVQDPSGAVSYFASDHLGSVTDVTTSAGTASLSHQYDPWGNEPTGSGASGYAFTGREWDAETGLYYYRARYYDPKIGRFISEDPLGLGDGPNLYVYVQNTPVAKTDPSGMTACWDKMTITAMVGPCTIEYVSASGLGTKCAEGAPAKTKAMCQELMDLIRKKGKTNLDPAVCPPGQNCANKKPITTWSPVSEEITFAVPAKLGIVTLGTCTVKVRVTGQFVGSGMKGQCECNTGNCP